MKKLREISFDNITRKVSDACIKSLFKISDDWVQALQLCSRSAPPQTKQLEHLLSRIDNGEILFEKDEISFIECYIKLGQEIHIVGGEFALAVTEGVRICQERGAFQSSVYLHPLVQQEVAGFFTSTHTTVVEGDRLRINLFAVSNVCSKTFMLTPDTSMDKLIRVVVRNTSELVHDIGLPFILGIGIGGNLEMSLLNSARAARRTIGQSAKHVDDAKIEKTIFNILRTSPTKDSLKCMPLAANIESFPCHIGSLPLAITIYSPFGKLSLEI